MTVRLPDNWLLLAYACALVSVGCDHNVGSPFVDRIAVSSTDTNAVWLRDIGEQLRLDCTALTADGTRSSADIRVSSAAGVVTGTSCAALAVQRSGHDTLLLQAGTVSRKLPIAVAVPPQVIGTLVPLSISGLPNDALVWWAPTVRRNSHGNVELYVAGYPAVEGDAAPGADLYRLTQRDPDGSRAFTFDGIALRHSTTPCSLMESGVENIAIVPRSDASGWRMFFAAGSFDCYGWQVFSAVSTDEHSWSIEPEVRISNGSTLPPAAPVSPPWPVGEGMVVRQPGPTDWEMIVGGTVPVPGRSNADFEIVQWHSTDQRSWTFDRPLFTLADLHLSAGRTLYSPTLREFAPGMYRMLFAEDGSTDLTTVTRLYSAVSGDGEHWRLEGTVYESPVTRVYYSTLLDEQLYTVCWNAGTPRASQKLCSLTITMP